MVTFAPLGIPIQRRLQTAAVIVIAVLPVLLALLNAIFVLNLILWPLYISYLLYIFLYDKDAPATGNRISPTFRTLRIWKYFRAYFPAKVVKTANLEPNRPYLFAMHPHGIIGISLWSNFLNATPGSFATEFPHIDVRCATLKMNFLVPFLRELLLWMGLVNAEKSTITGLLSRGKSALLMIGGAEESLHARPGNHELVLKKRKGFVRCALETGAALVPIYAFGENELFFQADNPQGSKLRKLQDFMKKLTGATIPAFYGRGILQYDYGIIPRRVPLVTVIGAPIEVPYTPKPTAEDVDKYHALYVERLMELYHRHKGEGELKLL